MVAPKLPFIRDEMNNPNDVNKNAEAKIIRKAMITCATSIPPSRKGTL